MTLKSSTDFDNWKNGCVSRYEEDTGMTIILDAQPSRGMSAESVEYEVW